MNKMNALRFLAMVILGTGYSFAQSPVDCNEESPQCCWVLRSFQLMQGTDHYTSDRFVWNFYSDQHCCYIDGVHCERRQEDDSIIIKSM